MEVFNGELGTKSIAVQPSMVFLVDTAGCPVDCARRLDRRAPGYWPALLPPWHDDGRRAGRRLASGSGASLGGRIDALDSAAGCVPAVARRGRRGARHVRGR